MSRYIKAHENDVFWREIQLAPDVAHICLVYKFGYTSTLNGNMLKVIQYNHVCEVVCLKLLGV